MKKIILIMVILFTATSLYGNNLFIGKNSWSYKGLEKLIINDPEFIDYGNGIKSGKDITRNMAAKLLVRIIHSGRINDMALFLKLKNEFKPELLKLGIKDSTINSNIKNIKIKEKEVQKLSKKGSSIKFGLDTRFRYESTSVKGNSSLNRNGFHMRNRFNIIINGN